MSIYPNILTPPMDSPEFLMFSPKSEGDNSTSSSLPCYDISQIINSPETIPEITTKPSHTSWLEIVEEPVEKFRFRYKSEMAGTHGSLNGRNSDKSKKQMFPSVKLQNFNGPAIVRCSIYQINCKEPHAHRLVKRSGPDEMDDPHDIEVGPEVGYTANFMNMGIIHTAKKHIVAELSRKYSVLKQESITREERIERLLTPLEIQQIKKRAESENANINLNQVRLRYEAFRKEGNALIPICQPIFSAVINNLKSALTGDLKIVRMDHCTSSSRGGREIFILVEKVTKKNIRVRFFELDDDDNEVWSDYGKFNDLDVHHQYAIVFRTPPYRAIDIEKPVKVYIELQRPSDGARSDPKDFTYTPCEIIQGRKRPRGSCSSYNSSNFSSNELPAILPNADFRVNSKDLEEALHNNNVNSEEFHRICNHLIGSDTNIQNLYIDDIVMDMPSTKAFTPSMRNKLTEDNIIRRVEMEIGSFLHSVRNIRGSPKPVIENMLESILGEAKLRLENGNNALHILILKNDYQDILIILLKLIQKYEFSAIANIPNDMGQTALHFAVETGNTTAIEFLLGAKADILQDLMGNTPLHVALMKELPESVLQLLLTDPNTESAINIKNNEGFTVLHLAAKSNNVAATKLLCSNNADINIASNTNGYTSLHMAVAEQHKEVISLLLDHDCDTSLEDFSGNRAVKLANVSIDLSKPSSEEIYQMLENHMKTKGTFEELYIKEEEHFEENSDMEVDIVKSEVNTFSAEPLYAKYKKITHLPEDNCWEIANILNTSGAWEILADRLDYGHMVRMNLFKGDANPAKSFLDFLMANGENLLRVRKCLNDMGEAKAIAILDNMVKEEQME